MIILSCRIEIQDKVRHLGENANDTEQQSIERQREMLALLLLRLKNSEHLHLEENPSFTTPSNEEAEYDHADAEVPMPSSVNLSTNEVQSMFHGDNPIPPEREMISLPYNDNFRDLEVNLRKKQAHRQLNRLRELIANKSFQYSHVIRKAPRKEVRTRGRKDIKKITHEIALHARIYSRCRDRLITLGCDEFRLLTKDDIRSSTAILNPNEPGSSKLHLSWIWNTARFLGSPDADAGADPRTLNECLYTFHYPEVNRTK